MANAKRKTKQSAARRKTTKMRAASVKKRTATRATAKPAAKKRAAKTTTKKPAAKRRDRQPKENAAVADAANMVVVTSGERPLHEVAADLRRAGFKVEQTLDAIGQLTGRAAPGLKSRLAKVRGVTDVSAEHQPFNLAPPDAPVQ
jgi:hypothetical protein